DQLETMPAVVVTTFDRAGREILPRRVVPPRPGGVRNMIPNIPITEPSKALLALGPATAPVEAVCVVGSIRALEASVRSNDDKDTRIILPILYTVTHDYLPGVRWDWHARAGLTLIYAALVLASAVLCGVICFWLGRRHAFALVQSAGWGFMGLGFGWMGLVLMLAVQEWPGRVACPNCRKQRVVTREACEHCGAGHAVPTPDGTEIFEDSVAAPESALATR
ncbi:MAG TPA: hypothetical protein VFA18_00580, partial [Gemmataceae bacterium]|nr:hypothetical protein [Gemmataceae bacterium]